jgi:N-acetylmuramoyl-L-alanine amidase
MPRFIWCLPVFFFLFISGSLVAQRTAKQYTVVIDAGHGGHDPGAIGLKAKEKNINLAVALKLGKLIRASRKDVKVVYTRDKDFFVELYRRAGIANEARADFFISIHCNANKNHALKGAETYVMGLHKSKANLDIAKLENAAILLESDYQSTYNGFDPNSDESYIVFSLNQNSNLDRSTDFAAAVQKQMAERVGMNDRGVRQAGFLVLYKTTMPSILVETGYLSNPDEEKFLLSERGQDFIASAICKAFIEIAGPEINPDIPAASGSGNVAESADNNESGKLSYRVQIASENTERGADYPKFSHFPEVKMYRHGGKFKYTVGDEPNLEAANRMLVEVKKKGIRDAFIVIFRNNERIPQHEADSLLKK